jgi:hypothetical protein
MPLDVMCRYYMQKRKRLIWGLILLGSGLFIAALSVNMVPIDESSLHVPRWVLALVSIIFSSTGFLVVLGQNSRGRHLFTGIILFAMSVIGVWIALFGSSEEFYGGLSILPRNVNVAMARILFGFFAMITLEVSAYAFRKGLIRDA